MADLRHGLKRADGTRAFESLADFPRATRLLGLGLKIAAGHVECNSIAPDVIQRCINTDVGSA